MLKYPEDFFFLFSSNIWEEVSMSDLSWFENFLIGRKAAIENDDFSITCKLFFILDMQQTFIQL